MHGHTHGTVEFEMHLARGPRGAIEVREGAPPSPDSAATALQGRVPRVARLAALALRIDDLVRSGQVRDYAHAARLGHITRARMTQITALSCLAPDILEDVLHLPLVERGRDPISERDLRPIAAQIDWRRQRALWLTLRAS